MRSEKADASSLSGAPPQPASLSVSFHFGVLIYDHRSAGAIVESLPELAQHSPARVLTFSPNIAPSMSWLDILKTLSDILHSTFGTGWGWTAIYILVEIIKKT